MAPLRDQHVTGPASYRHPSPVASAEANSSVNAWLETFVETAEIAVVQSQALTTTIDELRAAWTDRLAAYRAATGVRPTPRADSAVARLLAQLPEAPVVTATTLARILGVSSLPHRIVCAT